jgi:uncharacterized surface protein with fasciclin (FAS1) repeats
VGARKLLLVAREINKPTNDTAHKTTYLSKSLTSNMVSNLNSRYPQPFCCCSLTIIAVLDDGGALINPYDRRRARSIPSRTDSRMRSFFRMFVASMTAGWRLSWTGIDEISSTKALSRRERTLQQSQQADSSSQSSTLNETLQTSNDYSVFASLVEAAAPELFERLGDEGGAVSTSLFVPNNVALRKALNSSALPPNIADPDYVVHLNNLINFHATGGSVLEALVLGGGRLTMLNNESLWVTLTVNTGTGETETALASTVTNQTLADISRPQQSTSNGVLQELDRVLLPSFAFRDLVQLAGTISDISIFLFLVVDSGLDGTLASGEYTVLAPTNSAISGIGPEIVSSLSDKDVVTRFVKNHILSQVLPTSRISDSQVYRLETGESISARVSASGAVAFGNATVRLANQLANNGILHVINAVLMERSSSEAPSPAARPSETPPATESPQPSEVISSEPSSSSSSENQREPSSSPIERTLIPTVAPVEEPSTSTEAPAIDSSGADDLLRLVGRNPVYSSFAQLVSLVPGFEEILTINDSDGITVFGPTNDAIERMGPIVLSRLSSPGFHKHLRSLLSYHVSKGAMSASDLTNGTELVMLNDEPIQVQQLQGIQLSNTAFGAQALASVTDPNEEARNGFLHGIDGVLLPSFVFETVASLANATDSLSFFAELAARARLDFDLTINDCTLLAPSNAAFEALDATSMERLSNVGTLRAVLLNHVLLSVVPSAGFDGEGTYPSANGGTISVVPSDGGGEYLLSGARVVSADQIAWNGIIHVIDRVLLPNETALEVNSTSAEPSSRNESSSSLSSYAGECCSSVGGLASGLMLAVLFALQ